MADPFDPDAGKEGKRDGMDRAWRHADPEWQRIMAIAVRVTAEAKPRFTTDDLEKWRLIHHPNVTTPEKRALGQVMKDAAKAGICVKCTEHFEATEASAHRRPKRAWHSLIYKGPIRLPKPRQRKPAYDPRQRDLFWAAHDRA